MTTKMGANQSMSISKNNGSRLLIIGCIVLACVLEAAARPRWILSPLNTSIDVQRSGHSAVFDPITKAMIVFGGVGGGLNIESKNDVLRFNADGQWSTLIPNGAAGSP